MPRWYTFEEVALELAIPLKSIYYYHEQGVGPKVHKFGKHLRVADFHLRDWQDQHQIIKK